jgi:uncharacterized membrane protein
MSGQETRKIRRLDIILVVVAVSVLGAALWLWLAALPIAREIVFIATTIALVISLVLIVNVLILVMFRLQKRLTQLEATIGKAAGSETASTQEPITVVTLTNVERRIINRLEENGGSMSQDDLRRATGLSKSTLSVTITALERKSIIEREVNGRTRTVTLRRAVTK